MRSRCAVYVDAGYLLASAATRVTGTSLRSGVHVLYDHLIEAIIDQAEQSSDLPLLRVNWYDSGSRPGGLADPLQNPIGMLPRVKLRLGRLSNAGEQKGVDLRIGLDLVMHARNAAVDVMFLVSGDDDLSEAVEEVQGHGIPVIILAVPDARGRPHAVSKHLLREADDLVLVPAEAIDLYVQARTSPEPEGPGHPDQVPPGQTGIEVVTPPEPASSPQPSPLLLARRRPAAPGTPSAAPDARPAPAAARASSLVYSSATGEVPVEDVPAEERVSAELVHEVCVSVLTTWLARATAEEVARLRAGRPAIPGDIDRALLTDLSARTGTYYIEEHDRHLLRDRFWLELAELRT